MASRLSIAVVEEDHDRALMIVDGLRDAGDYDVTVIGGVIGLARKLEALAPRRRIGPHPEAPGFIWFSDWRARRDSNPWPLPSEGSALSS